MKVTATHAIDESGEPVLAIVFDYTTIEDGFGNAWPATCPDCGAPYEIIRPGDARCSRECAAKRGEGEGWE